MPTDKSFRKIGGATPPSVKGAEYSVKRFPAPAPFETKNAPPGQARSPQGPHLGSTRGVGAGGTRVKEDINRSSHSRAWGLKGS